MKPVLALICLLALQDARPEWEARAREVEAALRGAEATDTLHLKDGRKLSGKIEEETAASVRLKGRYGAMTFNRDDVAKIDRSPVAEFLRSSGPPGGRSPSSRSSWTGRRRTTWRRDGSWPPA